MVTLEDGNGTYKAETLAEAKKLKAARARAVKKANERYEAARARAERRAYLIMERVLTRGYSPYVFIDPDSDAGKFLAEVKDAPDEFCSYGTFSVNLHMLRDTDEMRGGEQAKLSHRDEKLTGLFVDGGGIVRAVELEDRFGAETVHAVAVYEDVDGRSVCVTAICPLVQMFHFRGDRMVPPTPYNLAGALRYAVEQMDKDARAIDRRHAQQLEEEAAVRRELAKGVE